ncbi:MAG TPA: membrane protein insertion efficiency factor YidD [Polyangiaceae bacterium]|nr:membrane protein insertion efficiency factor YidD [Polyangiaceae bacterium]
MFSVREQEARRSRALSALRAVAALVLLATVCVVADGARPPARQLGARLWVRAVHAWQDTARPLLAGRVACRYRPTCSEYSIEAVTRHGWPRGITLTVRRVFSCRQNVPLGTVDPVP